MSNPIMQMLSRSNQIQTNNPIQLFSQIKDFVKNLTPQAAEQKVNDLIQSGQINQEKLDEAIETAKKIQTLLNKR